MKRLRILWAALTDTWHQETCKQCGDRVWVQGHRRWSDPELCVPCETKQFDKWAEQYQARNGAA